MYSSGYALEPFLEEGAYDYDSLVLWTMQHIMPILIVGPPPSNFVAEREGQGHSHPGIARALGTAGWPCTPSWGLCLFFVGTLHAPPTIDQQLRHSDP